jgi:hypothetical protein
MLVYDQPMSSPGPEFPHPVFVGGTGRSGTTVTARLLGLHPRYQVLPKEVRFHADGLPELLEGRRSLEWFVKRLRNYWYFRVVSDGTERGVWDLVPPPEFEAAVTSFEELYPTHPEEAARALVRAFFDAFARRRNRATWVESTPTNAQAAPTLHSLFPSMRLIHLIRDGRDVACSVPKRRWGPTTIEDSLEWWARNLALAERGTAQVPDESVLTIRLEDFVRDRREETYARMLEFLELPDDPRMRRWFEGKMSGGRAHLGRWRSELSRDERARLEGNYSRVLEELSAQGVRNLPALR